ncbi:MAG: glutathione S-transferase family protein [Pseudomonadota bacterium]
MRPYILYGWHLSYFTGKVLCYLRYKKVPFEFRQVDMYTLLRRIKRETGAAAMPAVLTPERQWIGDSSVIIDALEQRFPGHSVVPETPVQRFASYLMEAWGDEWWVPIAMHTRWTYPENYPLFEREAGAALLPHMPAFAQRIAAARVARTLRGMLHKVGVRPAQFKAIDAWTVQMLDHLERHFTQQPYLFGARPSMGDFGLVGTMYGHLGRDPWPARELIAPRPNLRAWILRMANPPPPGALLAGDAIAPTLEPVFRAIFAEFLPLLEGINAQVKAALPALKPGHALRRALGDVSLTLAGGEYRRAALPYSLWMAQRTLDVFHALAPPGQAQVRAWAAPLGGERFLQLAVPRLRISGVRVIPQ